MIEWLALCFPRGPSSEFLHAEKNCRPCPFRTGGRNRVEQKSTTDLQSSIKNAFPDIMASLSWMSSHIDLLHPLRMELRPRLVWRS
jgi:hypothetical protein